MFSPSIWPAYCSTVCSTQIVSLICSVNHTHTAECQVQDPLVFTLLLNQLWRLDFKLSITSVSTVIDIKLYPGGENQRFILKIFRDVPVVILACYCSFYSVAVFLISHFLIPGLCTCECIISVSALFWLST